MSNVRIVKVNRDGVVDTSTRRRTQLPSGYGRRRGAALSDDGPRILLILVNGILGGRSSFGRYQRANGQLAVLSASCHQAVAGDKAVWPKVEGAERRWTLVRLIEVNLVNLEAIDDETSSLRRRWLEDIP